LPVGAWLREAYAVRDGLDALRAAGGRATIAFWGVAQTGKTTAIAELLDAEAGPGPEDTAGRSPRGALEWGGGEPHPLLARPGVAEGALNPFNAARDASSCAVRFFPGAGGARPADPSHPVLVRLMEPGELAQTLARGFDSECLGAGPEGRPEIWTPERFDRVLAGLREKHRAETVAAPNREAFERILATMSTLEDLVAEGIATFVGLRTPDQGIRSRIEAVLDDPAFTGNPNAADELAAQLFWGASGIVTGRHAAMRTTAGELARQWGDQPVSASLPAAALLLDLGACANAYHRPEEEHTPAGRQQRLIQSLGWREEGGAILVGCGPEYPVKLGGTAEHFANLQGLVMELAIPVNPANLKPGALAELLATTDLLDLPGVGREEKNENTRLNATPGILGANRARRCTVDGFYTDIVKRGKAAAAVAGLAKRRAAEGFVIVQDLDLPAPNDQAAGQVANGLRAWLRAMAPGFVDGAGRRPAGVSLNLALTCWGGFVKQAGPDGPATFASRKKYWEKLGPAGDPAVSAVFALNHQGGPGARATFAEPFRKGAPTYERMVGEPEWQRMFKEPLSQQSLEAMTSGADGDGASGVAFLFRELRKQAAARAAVAGTGQSAALAAELAARLEPLLARPDLRKPRVKPDPRGEELSAFARRLRAAIAGCDEARVRAASHALRELLNVDPEGLAMPEGGRAGITGEAVGQMLGEWKNRQVARYDEWVREGRKGAPDWSRLGLRDRDDLDRALAALIGSVGAEGYAAVAALAQRFWQTIPDREEHRRQHRRRYLALEMSNRLLYKPPGARPGRSTRPPFPPGEAATGVATAAYAAFIGPFLELQVQAILDFLTPPARRPPLNGDDELEAILQAASAPQTVPTPPSPP
jgi:hypothetical protein